MDDPDELQRRIGAILRDRPGDVHVPGYSDYATGADDLTARLMTAARKGGVAEALDELERMRPVEDADRLRRALMEFVTHDPAAVKLGLHVPWLEPKRKKR